MKKLGLFVALVFGVFSCIGQRSNTEIGLRLLSLELIPTYERQTNQDFIFYEKSNSSYTIASRGVCYPGSEVSAFSKYFKDLPSLKTTGVYIPGIYIRQKLTTRFWVRGLIEGYSMRTYSTESFAFLIGSLGVGYTSYDKKIKGLGLEYSFQYQWLTKSKFSLATSIEGKLSYAKIRDNSHEYISGCFNSELIQPRNFSSFVYWKNFKIVNSLSVPIYKKYSINYELAFPLVEQRLSISRYL